MRNILRMLPPLCVLGLGIVIGYWSHGDNSPRQSELQQIGPRQIGPFQLGFDPAIAPTAQEPIELTVIWPDTFSIRFHNQRTPSFDHPVVVQGMSYPGRAWITRSNGRRDELPIRVNPMEFTWKLTRDQPGDSK
jgi:hypothetical protein